MTKDETIVHLYAVKSQQEQLGGWDSDPYMIGLHNGIEVALSLLEDRDADMIETDNQWSCDEI